ncbi:tetratricopeptide repeat protein [Cytophagaceae bacterium SJW1-29]|uniref:Tetratricopeptide repeat protein n=2 Tax=Salmonirosea aquatica TaxID=2654236 RepID=A0A7C9BFC1_9BACT|nr:tetratricopeptide repeat protein [Cytophagaceae bacterium SJW1-29]
MYSKGMTRIVGAIGLVWALGLLPCSAQKRNRNKDKDKGETEQATTFRLEEESMAAEGMKYMMMDEPSRALPVFEKLVKASPSDAAGHFMLASALLKLDRATDALPHATLALGADPTNSYYAAQLGEIYVKQKNYSEAAKIYEKLVSQNPTNVEYGVELAAMYVFNDQFDKAIATYDQMEKSMGVTEEITHQKEQLYLRLNKFDKAIEEANKLIASEPSELDYRIELAELLIANERIDEAVAPLEEALRLNPDEAQAHVLLADIYRRKGDVEKTNRELQVVFANPNLDAEPKVRVLSGYLTMLKTDKDREDAANLARQLVETHPKESRALVLYADMLVQQGRKAEARDVYVRAAHVNSSVYEVWGAVLQLDGELNQADSLLVHSEQALEVFPNQGMIWYSNGSAQLMKRNYKRAVSSLEESRRLMENAEMKLLINAQLGDAYNGLGDNAKSDASYELVLKDDPNNDHVLNNYSYFLSLRKDKLDLALQLSERLVQKNPDNATFLDTYAWVLYIRKDYKKAKTFLEKAVQAKEGVSGTIVEHYGDVLFQLGEREKAVEQWKKAKTMGETSDLLEKKIATGTLHEQ